MHNPSRNINPIECRTQLEMKVFRDLGVVEEDVEKTYLAVFFTY